MALLLWIFFLSFHAKTFTSHRVISTLLISIIRFPNQSNFLLNRDILLLPFSLNHPFSHSNLSKLILSLFPFKMPLNHANDGKQMGGSGDWLGAIVHTHPASYETNRYANLSLC
eukprot:508732_1